MASLLQDLTQEQPDGREAWGRVWEKGSELPLSEFTAPEGPPKPLLWAVWSLHHVGAIDEVTGHGGWGGGLIPPAAPLPSPEDRSVDGMSQPSNLMDGSPGNQPHL